MKPVEQDKTYDIFISHSHQDDTLVQEIYTYLEKRRLKCWVSKRVEDNPGGIDYTAQITNSIKTAAIFVVVLTPNANNSKAVAQETGIAYENNKWIIPFLLDRIDINASLTYYLTRVNPVGYFKGSRQERMGHLYKSCQYYLQKPVEKARPPGLIHQIKTGLRKPGFKWSAITVLTAIVAFGLYAAFNHNKLWCGPDSSIKKLYKTKPSASKASTTGDNSPAIITRDGNVNINYGDSAAKKNSTKK